jgi:acetyltransferase-like isoleucine patch superfamily enzyme
VKPAFDENFFRHINEARIAETGHPSRAFSLLETLMANPVVRIPLSIFEKLATFILTLPIPIYASIIRLFVDNARGLPRFSGVYLRALYYRGIVKDMESNVMIEQGVFLAHPKSITLKEFSFLDKNVVIMARNCYIGRRVHIAVNSFVNGGGDFYAGDYSGVSPGCQFMTSTEVLKGGARCSGPMVSADQRNVHRGKVVLEKDAFVGAGSTILTDVIVAEGSVIGGGVTVSRSTEPWGIYVGAKPALIGHRDKVKHPDN